MVSIALALASAIAWGTGDFLGGLKTKRFAVPLVLVGTSLGGVLFALVMALGSGQEIPPGRDLAIGAASGVVGLIALGAFYKALAIGTMSIVAPVSSSGTAIPVIWGIAHGESLSALAYAGLVAVVIGVMIASREQDAAAEGQPVAINHRASIMLALVGAVGFGTIYVMIAEASTVSEFWPIVALKGTSLVVISLVVLAAWSKIPGDRPTGRLILPLMLVGILDVTANATYAFATTEGPIAIASVVASMFPITTVILAHLILGERIAQIQKVGVALALIGVVVLAGT